MHNIELVGKDGFTKTIIIYPLISPYCYVIRCSYTLRPERYCLGPALSPPLTLHN